MYIVSIIFLHQFGGDGELAIIHKTPRTIVYTAGKKIVKFSWLRNATCNLGFSYHVFRNIYPPWFQEYVHVLLVKFTKVKVEYTRYQRLKCFSKYGIFYDLQGTHYRALCKYCWCCGSDNYIGVVPVMMLSVNITISMVPLDEIICSRGKSQNWVFLNQDQFQIYSSPPWLILWRGKPQHWGFVNQSVFKNFLLTLTQIMTWEALKPTFFNQDQLNFFPSLPNSDYHVGSTTLNFC